MLILSLNLFLISLSLNAQELATKGKITSKVNGDIVEGAAINIKGSSIGTTSDQNGEFTLTISQGSTLIISMAGYKPVEIIINDQPSIAIELENEIGSEMIATRIAIDMIIEVRYKLRMLGVPIRGASLLLGDNMSVVLNTTIPSSPIKKKHLSCAYHRIREAIAAGIIDYAHVSSKENVADIFTKPLPIATFQYLAAKYLFRKAKTVTEGHVQEVDGKIEGE